MPKLIIVLNICLDLNIKQPSHSTVINWIKKIGLYQLQLNKTKADDWILLIDESILVGGKKLLLIMGIRSSKYKFDKPLNYSDLIPFRCISSQSWTAVKITKVIKELKEELGDIQYVISDQGNNIVKSINTNKQIHIPDVEHYFALILKHKYENNELFNQMIKTMAQMKFRFSCSKIAYITPPAQRSDSRFMNITPLIDWAIKSLNIFKVLINKEEQTDEDKKIIEELKWLHEIQDFVLELHNTISTINQVSSILKNNGFSKKSKNKCLKKLSQLRSREQKTIKQEIIDYFKYLDGFDLENIIVSTDIVESCFGKYKEFIGNNSKTGITDLALSIAAFTFNPNSSTNIEKALKQIKMKDIKEWKDQNIEKSLHSKRLEYYKLTKVG